MNQIVKQEINFKSLVQNSTNILSLNIQSTLIDALNKIFTESEQQWYITNLYIYMNYHQTTDFVVNLENIYKMIGFANKANAKRTLKNNFVLNENYKIIFIPRDENSTIIQKDRGRQEENIMLNIDTFKNLCMISKTDKGKEIRKYYVKLENVYNSIIKDDYEKQLQQKTIENIKDKEQILLESYNKKSIIYLIFISGILWKFGYTNDINVRLNEHRRDINKDIQLIWCIESIDNIFLEKELKDYLKNTTQRKEQVFTNGNGKQHLQTELIEIHDISIIQKRLVEMNKYINIDKNVKFRALRFLNGTIKC